MRRVLLGVLMALLALPLSLVSVVAQEATPATPAGAPLVAECNAPDLPPGTPSPMEQLGPPDAQQATPADTTAVGPVEATPAEVTGEPADAEVTAEVEAAVNNLAACINEGEFVAFAALFTTDALLEECGTTNPYDGEWCFGGTPFIEILTIENIQVWDDGRYSADTYYQIGNMLLGEQFIFVRQGDWLLVDASPDLPMDIPEDATVIEGEMADYEFVLSQQRAPAGTIAFDVTNTGEYPHELGVLRLPEGTTVEDLFEDESLFEQVEFFGYTFAEPGEVALPLVLVDMEPGEYTLVCFVDEPEGVPHVMRGMVLDFEVTAP